MGKLTLHKGNGHHSLTMFGSEPHGPCLRAGARKLLGSTILAGFVLGSVMVVAPTISMAQESARDDLEFLLQEEMVAEPKTRDFSGKVNISVDGETVVGERVRHDDNRIADVDLEQVDIQVKYDGLDVTRRLNVSTIDERRTFEPGEEVRFYGSTNYADWIRRAEIRIYRATDRLGAQNNTKPLDTINIPLDEDDGAERRGYASWVADIGQIETDENGERYRSGIPGRLDGELIKGQQSDLVYTLRVYDENGRFDETAPLSLKVTERAGELQSDIESETPGYSEDRVQITNIPLHGGTVTVSGKNIPPGYRVYVMGRDIPVGDGPEGEKAFVTSQILEPGEHVVDVKVAPGYGSKDDGISFEREVTIPDNEWFFVGLADVTVGKNLGEDSEFFSDAAPGEYSKVYKKGRLAFYLKGKVKGEYLITAAADTTEEDLDEMFSSFDKKSPRALLRRLDPDDYYPVYGDDSTTIDDAPTSGRFYVRIEKGENHVMWGDYKTRINGSEFGRFERTLYGAKVHLETDETTSFGEPIAELEAFAAQPGTLPQRDEFRGTGGSAYFLRRQDISRGSEQLTIEVRDGVTGLTIDRRILRPGEDYDFDYVQGVVILRRPLASTTSGSGAVRETATGGDMQFLVAQYEYVPALDDIDGYSYGGRVQTWLADTVRVGVTGFQEGTEDLDQDFVGADVHVRLSDKSFFEFEWAKSRGDTIGVVRSDDGGFIFNPISGNGPRRGWAEAYRAKLAIDLAEATGGQIEGAFGAYYEKREMGFNSPGRYATEDETLFGVHAEIIPDEDQRLTVRYDSVDRDNGNSVKELIAEYEKRIDDDWKVSVGVLHSDVDVVEGEPGIGSRIGSRTKSGTRTDVGARLTWEPDESFRTWVFGQLTVDKSGDRDNNDRIGVGIETDLTDKVSASLEVSTGSKGVGAQAAVTYEPTASDRYYMAYRIDPDTTAGDANGLDAFNRDYGSIVFGASRKIDETLTGFFEENYDFSGTQRSLTHTYGISFTPDPVWTLSAGFEAGEIYDSVDGDFERMAISSTVSYRDEGLNGSLRLEARFEDGINDSDTAVSRDRETYLMTASVGVEYDVNWRFIGKVDAAVSNSDEDAFLDGDYVEASVGFAYRPVDNDRLNALFKYTYLHDLPGPQQVNKYDEIAGPKQRSHVLSADFIYQVNDHFSVGGKYGFRIGEVSVDRTEKNFEKSSAHLGVLRVDWHVVKEWDAVGEVRALWLPEADQVDYGALVGIYKHVNENLKVGVGYNFGKFSDDLTDLTYDDEGVFLNVIGKY